MNFKLTDMKDIYALRREGNWKEYPVFSSYSQDSRTIMAGGLFLARKGEKDDGNLHISEAINNGASFVIAERLPPGTDVERVPVLITDDTARTLLELTHKVRSSNIRQRVIAVTGSFGKTTTKDMIFSVLRGSYLTGRTEGNMNSEWGVPHTVLNNMDKDVLIVEMGMDREGDIDILAECVMPDIGVITNIGAVHLEFLGSVENVLHGKLGLFRKMAEGALKLVNGDDRLLVTAKGRFSNVVTFGAGKENDDVFTPEESDHTGGIAFSHKGERYGAAIWGGYNLYNAAPAVIIGSRMGLSPDEIDAGLSTIPLSTGRSELIDTGGRIIINDTYNSSPGALICVLRELSNKYRGKKILLCLGDMLELGAESGKHHRAAAELAGGMAGAKALFLGEGFSAARAACSTHEYYTDRKVFAGRVMELSADYDVILFKGSRGMHMEEFMGMIRESL